MKRPLVWLAAALAAAAVVLTLLPSAKWFLTAAALVGVGLALARFVPPGWRGRALVVCAGLLLAVGSVMAFQVRAAAFAELDGKEAPVRMTVLQEEEGPGYSMVTLYGKVQTGRGWKTTTLRASSYGIAGWQPGDKVEGVLKCSIPEDAADLRYLYSRGRFLKGRIQSLEPLPESTKLPGGPVVWGARLNHALSEGLLQALPGENGAFVQSVLLGRREALSDHVDEDMRRSGAAHVLVVSGLHLSLLCGAVLMLLRRAGAGRIVRLGVGVAVCLGVMTVAGFTPSVSRAGVMMMLTLGADALHRKSDSFSSLSVAGLLMGLANPYVFYSWSFILSVTSILSILIFVPPIQRHLLDWRRNRFPTANWADRVLSVVSVSLGAAVYTYPVLLVMFGGLPLYGLLGNLLITPLVGVLLVSAALAALFGAAGLGSVAAVAALPAAVTAAICRWAAAFVAALPASWLPIDRSWQMVWLAAAAVVLSLLVLYPAKKKSRNLLAGASLTAVLLVGMVSSALVQGNVVELRTFEDSGSLLILRDDQAVLVDADREGAYQAELLAPEQVLYTFGQQNAQEAAILLQDTKPQAALLWQDTAREISPYLPAEITLLDAARPVRLAEGISLRAGEGYTLLELDGIRVLKIAGGYVIMETGTGFPVADLLVDGGGMIHHMAEPGGESRSLRLRLPR